MMYQGRSEEDGLVCERELPGESNQLVICPAPLGNTRTILNNRGQPALLLEGDLQDDTLHMLGTG